MKYLANLILVLSVFVFNFASAGVNIVETDSLKSVYSHLNKLKPKKEKILVIFDIDKTLLLVKECKLNNPRVRSFIRWSVNVKVCATDITETRVIKDIQRLQKGGFHTLSLTARKNNLIAATERELDRHNIEFENHPFSKRANYKDKSKPKRVVELKDGVIYASGNAKGKVLTAFLKRIKTKYDKILFIDDSIKNVKSLRHAFKKRKDVELTVFHYTKFIGH